MTTPAPLALSALNLPEHLHDYLGMCLRVITTTAGALRDRNEQRALGVVEAFQHRKDINRAEGDVLRQIIADTAQAARVAPADQQDAPALILPSCRLEGDELVIRITTDTLLHSVTLGEQWPTDYKGEPLATIVDRPLFVQDIIHELLREDEQGATPLHRLFDQAAEDALEAGSEAVVLRDEDDDAEGEA